MYKQQVTISFANLLVIVTTGLLLVLLWQLRSLIVVVMIAVLLAAAISPIVTAAERWGIPRFLGVISVYLAAIAGLTGLGWLIGPTVVDQIQNLISTLPTYLENLGGLAEKWALRLGITDVEAIGQVFETQAVTSWVIRSSQQLLMRSYGITRGIIGGVLSLILALLLSAYMVAGSQNLIKGLLGLFPHPWDERLAAQVKPIGRRIGGYIQGRVLVSAVLALAISVGLGILGLSQFALGLGVIAGVTNLIPFIGPVLGVFPALLVALSQGWWTVLWVSLLFTIIQTLETYVLDPLLVGPSVRVHPLYQLLAVLGGTQVLGIVGALIVPPWVAGASVVLENLYLRPKRSAERQAEGDRLEVSRPKQSLASGDQPVAASTQDNVTELKPF